MHLIRVGLASLAMTGILAGVLSCSGDDVSVQGLSPTAPARDGLVSSSTCLEDCDAQANSCIAVADAQLSVCLSQAGGDPTLIAICYSQHESMLQGCAGAWGACVNACSGGGPDPDPEPDPGPIRKDPRPKHPQEN